MKSNQTRHKNGANYEFWDKCPQCGMPLHYVIYVRIKEVSPYVTPEMYEEWKHVTLSLGEETEEPEIFFEEGFYYIICQHYRYRKRSR